MGLQVAAAGGGGNAGQRQARPNRCTSGRFCGSLHACLQSVPARPLQRWPRRQARRASLGAGDRQLSHVAWSDINNRCQACPALLLRALLRSTTLFLLLLRALLSTTSAVIARTQHYCSSTMSSSVVVVRGTTATGGPPTTTTYYYDRMILLSWCGRQHKLVTEIIVSSPMQPKPPDGIRMCVLLLRVHLVRYYYYYSFSARIPG